MAKNKKILMCPPTYFDIEYEINPWMHKENTVISAKATNQWQKLYDIYSQQLGWKVQLIEPVKNLPDMVFAADNCLVLDNKVLLSRFRYPQRRLETERYEQWFFQQGFTNIKRSSHFLEGGDILIFGDKIIAGYGMRSDLESHRELGDYFGREVISLHIIDPYFYHLDVALAVLDSQTIAFYPNAIDKDSQRSLRKVVSSLIEVTEEEAKSFGLNVVSDGQTVIFSDHSPSLEQKYRAAGFQTIGIAVGEFIKSGGGVKCLTLELN
jgi:N-dimethylarginine dimethylaminohydrolase